MQIHYDGGSSLNLVFISQQDLIQLGLLVECFILKVYNVYYTHLVKFSEASTKHSITLSIRLHEMKCVQVRAPPSLGNATESVT